MKAFVRCCSFFLFNRFTVGMPVSYVKVGNPPRRVAVQRDDRSSEQGLLFLPGFNSRMASIKGDAIADWACTHHCSCTRFDYSGHGESEGKLEDGTISRWLEESVSVFSKHTQGKQILVGSSMGGYLALLLWKHFLQTSPEEAARIQGLILIAPAWDMTKELLWNNFTEDIQNQIRDSGVYHRPSTYGDGPYPITRNLINDGKKHLLFADNWRFPKQRPPIRILHGIQDHDVPHTHSNRLIRSLEEGNTQLRLVDDGDHRLSRPQDLEYLRAFLSDIVCHDTKLTK